jgi:hypothetical protein
MMSDAGTHRTVLIATPAGTSPHSGLRRPHGEAIWPAPVGTTTATATSPSCRRCTQSTWLWGGGWAGRIGKFPATAVGVSVAELLGIEPVPGPRRRDSAQFPSVSV